MQTDNSSPTDEESFPRMVVRNVAIATAVSAAVTLPRHDYKSFLPVAALALWPSFGGHYVEMAFDNAVRSRISQGRLIQAAARLLVWFVGGVLLYMCMVVTSRFLPIRALPPGLWWCGGFVFVGIELVVHTILAMRGRPNFYNGRG